MIQSGFLFCIQKRTVSVGFDPVRRFRVNIFSGATASRLMGLTSDFPVSPGENRYPRGVQHGRSHLDQDIKDDEIFRPDCHISFPSKPTNIPMGVVVESVDAPTLGTAQVAGIFKLRWPQTGTVLTGWQ